MTVKAPTNAAETPAAPATKNFVPDDIQKLPLDQQLQVYWQSAENWFQNNTLEIIIAAVVGSLIYLGLNWLRGFAKRRAQKIEDKASLARIALNVLARTSQFFVIMVPLVLTDFQRLLPDLPVRGGAFAALVLVQATSRLMSGRGRPARLLADITVMAATGALVATAAIVLGLGEVATLSLAAGALELDALLQSGAGLGTDDVQRALGARL